MTLTVATTISQLPLAGPINGTEYVAITQNGQTVRTPYTSAASVRIPIVISGNVNVNPTDVIIEINQSVPSAVTVNLPSNPVVGLIQTVKDGAGVASVYHITLLPSGGRTIDGQGHYQMNSDWNSVSYYYNGTNFRIVCGY